MNIKSIEFANKPVDNLANEAYVKKQMISFSFYLIITVYYKKRKILIDKKLTLMLLENYRQLGCWKSFFLENICFQEIGARKDRR